MKINKKMIWGISISVVLALSIFTTVYLVVIRNKKIDDNTIIIWGDRDFKNYDFPGKGTAEDPYLIQDYNIDTASSRGIYITGTTKYFVIQNSVIKAANTAIYISNTAEGTVSILNNDCSNNGFNGIYVIDSPSSQIIDNTCNNNQRENGINVIESPNSIISRNTCNNNTGSYAFDKNFGIGIYICNSENSTIKNNICEDNFSHGIDLFKSTNSEVDGNELSENRRSGILIDDSKDTIISSNLLSNNTLNFEDLAHWSITSQILRIKKFTLDYYLSFTVLDNYVNEEPLGFYKNLNDAELVEIEDGQSIFINCFNLTVHNTISENSLGMSFYFCHSSFISNNSVSYSPVNGISIYHSNNVMIKNNTCNFNTLNGIFIYNCNESTVNDNTCIQNYSNGIGSSFSWDLNFLGNYCRGTRFSHGISANYGENIVFEQNTCINNFESGIGTRILVNVLINNNTISENGHGLYLNGAKSFNISHNIVTNNKEHGIVFSSKVYRESVDNIIHNNLIANNSLYGVFLASYTNNTEIYHNSFRNNNMVGSSQAFDSAFDNTWYNSLLMEGNWWSDWVAGTYDIDGTAGSVDLYPLVVDPWL